MRRVAIIGGGFSGCCVAAHLLRDGAGAPVVLVERQAAVGRGAAYGTREPEHLLNVPAERMGLWADAPGDFLRWVRRDDPAAAPEAFLPRRLYAAYLAATLADAERAAPGRLTRIAAEATGLERLPGRWRISFAGAPPVEAETVVLATGIGAPPDPCAGFRASLPPERYLPDPWAPDALASFPVRGDVLLLGTGLTMVDVALFLAARHPRIGIEAVSPRGHLPRAHLETPEAPGRLDAFDPARPLRVLLRDYRRRQAEAEAQGRTWRAAFDALRPHHIDIWRHLSAADRKRFLRHLRHLWNIHRHRMPASPAATLERLRREGRLRLHAGRAVAVAEEGGLLAVWLRDAAGVEETVRVRHLVNCCGPEADCGQGAPPLLRALAGAGRVVPDPLRLGLETTGTGALRGRDGTATPGLYAVGPMRRAAEWESTAVPELRVQAAALARLLDGPPPAQKV